MDPTAQSPTPLQNPSEISPGQDISVVPGKPFILKRTLLRLGAILIIIILIVAAYVLWPTFVNFFKKTAVINERSTSQPIGEEGGESSLIPLTEEKQIDWEKIVAFEWQTQYWNQYITNASTSFTIAGTINSIDTINEDINGISYIYQIELRKDGALPTLFKFTQYDIDNSSVILFGVNTYKEVKIPELAVDDVVNINIVSDLFESTHHGYKYAIKATRKKAYLSK